MTSTRNATAGCTVATSRGKTTRSRERGHVEILSWIIFMVGNWADDVGTSKKLAATVKILREEIIHAERLGGLHCINAVDPPTIGEALPVPFAVGKLIDEVPGQVVGNVKV